MSRIKPLNPNELPPAMQAALEESDQMMGFTANDVLTMAKWPALLQAMGPVVHTVYGPGEVSAELKCLVGFIASTAAGCRYCQAHTLHGADRAGVDQAKLDVAWEFETHPLFSDAERAALRVARGGGSHPNSVSDDDFETLRAHFSEQQTLEIVAVIALFGFLNRWNETLATTLENEPKAFAAQTLGDQGWEAGKH